MTESKERQEVRRQVRRAAAELVQWAFVRGDLYSGVLGRLREDDDGPITPYKRIVAQECDAEVRALLVRAMPVASASKEVAS